MKPRCSANLERWKGMPSSRAGGYATLGSGVYSHSSLSTNQKLVQTHFFFFYRALSDSISTCGGCIEFNGSRP